VTVHSFAPIANASSRVLVLGSMPGIASLRANQYYAHPRNAFWRIMGTLFGFDAGTSYRSRTTTLRANGVALWDVLKTCTRTSSLDSDILPSSVVVNDFAGFLAKHRGIGLVCFNGSRAEHEFRKHVLARLPDALDVEYRRLPSTSPANAGVPYATKLAAWRVVQRAAGA
jgi:hypoxanthine-DNA glycosylase